jgi:ribosomal protein L7/L12
MREWIQEIIFWALIGFGIALTQEFSEKQLIGIGLVFLLGIFWRLSDIRDDLRGAAAKLGYSRDTARRVDKLLKKQSGYRNDLTKAENEELKELCEADSAYSVAKSGQLIRVLEELRRLTNLVDPSKRRKKTMRDENGVLRFVHEHEIATALQKGWSLPAFSVVLTDVGANKFDVIKAVREVTSLSVDAAWDLVNGVPNPIKEVFTEEEAVTIRRQLEKAGAKAEVE